MLSLGKLGAGQAQYYLDTVADGAEEYYVGGKEAPGQWCGTSSALLGLSGQVDGETLHRLLNHRHPLTGERLTAARSVPKVVGFDATFSAPKSVSLLFALGDPEASNEVRNAHDAAVADALRVYEQIASGRRGKAGKVSVEGDGFVAAAFRHRTSRNADPQLHTHVVVANVVHSQTDDRWTALDGRPLYTWARPVGFLYEAHLRWELTRRLGVDWTPIRNGIGDIVGFSPQVLKAFSSRRAEIDERLAILGRDGAKAAQDAVYATRKPKDRDVDARDLLPEWRARAAALGLDDEAIAMLQHNVAEPQPIDRDAVFEILSSPSGLTAKRATFGRKHVIEAICTALPHGGRPVEVLELVEDYVRSPHVIRLDVTSTPPLHVGGGRLVPAGAAEEQWTTPEMLAVERHLLEGVAVRRHDRVAIAAHQHVVDAIGKRPTLSVEQRRMIEQICSSGAGVDVIEGIAGAGKTFALAAAREAWAASGHRVRGASLAARTAARLEVDSGIPSTSLDRLLLATERGEALNRRDVIVVDEAAMVGTRQLARLLDHAAAGRAKVVLVGDPRQLPEIDAGGAFAGLTTRFGDARLADNRRQVEPWERAALAALRGGNPDVAIASYRDHDRIHEAHDPRAPLIEDWWESRQRGERGLMIASRLREVDDLNRRARALLAEHGALGEEVVLGGRPFAVGDVILALRNDYDAGVLNGTIGSITAVDRRRDLLMVDSDTGRVAVPFAYAESGKLTHGYATTLHKAQGATAERTFVLADESYAREHLYTAMSRGTTRNDLYLDRTVDDRADVRHAPELQSGANAGLRRAAGRSAAQALAVDQADDRLVPTRVLEAERAALLRSLSAGPADPNVDLREICRKMGQARACREDGVRRLDLAEGELAELGPIGRRLHRRQRDELLTRRADAMRTIERADAEIVDLSARANTAAEALPTWRRWQHEHAPGLARLRALSEEIGVRHLQTGVEQERTADRGVDHGMSL